MSSINTILTIGAISTALAAIGYVINKTARFIKIWIQFIDDWAGTKEHPGVIERLKEGNERFDKIEKELSIVKAELFTNGGSSVRDAINRIEAAVTKNKEQF